MSEERSLCLPGTRGLQGAKEAGEKRETFLKIHGNGGENKECWHRVKNYNEQERLNKRDLLHPERSLPIKDEYSVRGWE